MSFFWDWIFDFLPLRAQIALLLAIGVGVGLLILWAVYG